MDKVTKLKIKYFGHVGWGDKGTAGRGCPRGNYARNMTTTRQV